jgi:hypothetical protein
MVSHYCYDSRTEGHLERNGNPVEPNLNIFTFGYLLFIPPSLKPVISEYYLIKWKTCDKRVIRQKGNPAIRRVYKGLKGGVYVHSGNDHNIWGANQFSTFMRTRAAL